MKISRRAFARDAIVAATAAAVLPSALAQQAPTAPPVAPAHPKPEQPAAPELSPAMRAEAEARIQMVIGKYGSRLSEAQQADIRRLITAGQAGFESFRAYPLDNAVEPSMVFRAARPRRRTPSRVTTHERKVKS
jgi:type IV pilus biogenesis protein CpaD/CtpE